jgi:hypothetical protein
LHFKNPPGFSAVGFLLRLNRLQQAGEETKFLAIGTPENTRRPYSLNFVLVIVVGGGSR